MRVDKHNSELIEKLKSVIDSDKDTILLLPEVTKLEYQKKVNTEYDKKRKEIEELQQGSLEKMKEYPEEQKNIIEKAFNDIVEKTNQNKESANSTLDELFNSKNTKQLSISSDLIVNAYKRMLAEKKPFNKEKYSRVNKINIVDNDSVAFESIIAYLSAEAETAKANIIFCTKDNDFLDNKDVFASELEEELKKLNVDVSFYSTLVKMLEEGFQEKLQEETIEQYEDLSAKIAMPDNTIDWSKNIIPVNPSQLSLGRLSVDKDGFLTMPSIISSLSLGENFNSQGLTYEPATDLLKFSINQKICSSCGKYFEKSPTDFCFTNECPECRSETSLGDFNL